MRKLQKILLLLKIPPPVTGATIINQCIYKSKLLNKKFDLKFVNVSYKFKINDTKIFSFIKIYKIINQYYRIIKSLIIFKPNMVYFQISPVGWAFYRDCTFIIILKFFHKHIVFHLHGKGIIDYVSNSSVKLSLYKWAFKNSYVICLAYSLTQDIEAVYTGIPYIVNNGIPRIQNFAEKIENKKVLTIIFLSNLLISKGIYDFLDAAELYSSRLQLISVQFFIIGQEVDLTSQNLSMEINKRKLNNVHYLGPKYDLEKYKLLNESDLFVYPTLNDAWGLVILEAMQAGLPVIATREGAIPEIVDDGITGFLVDKHRPDQIADKMELLINDFALRKRMGEAGRKKFLEKYTLEIFEKNMLTVFEDVLQKISKS